MTELLADVGDARRSSELYRLLLGENDEDPSLWLGLARQLEALGETAEVGDICRRLGDEELPPKDREWCGNRLDRDR